MSDALNYLRAYRGHFWRFEDGGRVIAVPDGRTLGYTERVVGEILPHLAPQGLPRFGALLLALAATTSDAHRTLDDIRGRLPPELLKVMPVREGMRFARVLADLPPRFRRGDLRTQLLQSIFASTHLRMSARRSARVVAELGRQASVASLLDGQPVHESPALHGRLRGDFGVLAWIGKRLPDTRAVLRHLAGMTGEAPAPEELTPATAPPQADLMNQLIDHPETYHIGTLVPELIGGLRLARHRSRPGEQPLGGVTDLTTRGRLDRLLISEHAFTDEVLLSRLANDEALYQHREAPPTDSNRPRLLLIDNTLRNWGNVRTLSLAVALAIREHPRNQRPTRAYLVGQSYREIGLGSVLDIVAGLGTLDASLDPGPGVGELLRREQVGGAELYFIGSAESRSAPGLTALDAPIDHWIHPDREGLVRVFGHPRRGRRLVQELRLPLERRWAGPREQRELPPPVPLTDYPILFPDSRFFKGYWAGPRHLYALSKGKNLYRRYGGRYATAKGWEQVAGEVRRRDELYGVITHEDLSVSVLFRTIEREFTIVRYPGGARLSVPPDRRLRKAKRFYVADQCFRTELRGRTVSIEPNGTVSDWPATGTGDYSVPVRPPAYASAFRCVNRVFVTTQRTLCFGKQSLDFRGEELLLAHRGAATIEPAVVATPGPNATFTFPDGSTVRHEIDGMLRLSAADPVLPDIFLPCQIDQPVGVATVNEFAGPDYYRKRPLTELLIAPAHRPDHLPELIGEILTGYPAEELHGMAHAGAITCADGDKLNRLEAALRSIPYRIRHRGLHQRELTPREFYDRYFVPFITSILDRGT